MNAVVEFQEDGRTLAMSEDELIDVLQSSLYPGAALSSIKMVISYCRAAALDPMQKPVHIVPMWDKNSKSMRDVIMPGVGLYRTQAARSNALAGISEPEFGPDVEFELDGQRFRAPEWCRVTVKRILPNGSVGEFFAKEYWIENYATAGKDSVQPNTMWRKRPRGQLAKCAEAQALRRGFPEMTGSAPTADEMEGKAIDAPASTMQEAPTKPAPRPKIGMCTPERFEQNQAAWRDLILAGKKTPDQLIVQIETKGKLTEDQKLTIDSWAHEND